MTADANAPERKPADAVERMLRDGPGVSAYVFDERTSEERPLFSNVMIHAYDARVSAEYGASRSCVCMRELGRERQTYELSDCRGYNNGTNNCR